MTSPPIISQSIPSSSQGFEAPREGLTPDQSEELLKLPFIRCLTCGKVIGQLRETYKSLTDGGMQPDAAFEHLGLTRYCCRMNLANPGQIAPGLLYHNPRHKSSIKFANQDSKTLLRKLSVRGRSPQVTIRQAKDPGVTQIEIVPADRRPSITGIPQGTSRSTVPRRIVPGRTEIRRLGPISHPSQRGPTSIGSLPGRPSITGPSFPQPSPRVATPPSQPSTGSAFPPIILSESRPSQGLTVPAAPYQEKSPSKSGMIKPLQPHGNFRKTSILGNLSISRTKDQPEDQLPGSAVEPPDEEITIDHLPEGFENIIQRSEEPTDFGQSEISGAAIPPTRQTSLAPPTRTKEKTSMTENLFLPETIVRPSQDSSGNMTIIRRYSGI